MKVCVISEGLSSPLDEGFKKFSYSLIKNLTREHHVLGMSKTGLSHEGCRVARVRMNRLFLNWGLWRRIRRFHPQMICYVPSASGTFNSFLRARILGWYGRKARVILISLQPRSFSVFQAMWLPHICPHLVLVQSRRSARAYQKLGCPCEVFPGGVELSRFTPVSEPQKKELRRRHGVPLDAFLVLHVGHINAGRRVQLLERIQGQGGIQVILVSSSSTPHDAKLLQSLERAGVIVRRDYIENIQEIYQLSDCYLFQVSSERAAVELPLSVLEAMACNLPIITTRYGALGDLFHEGAGLLYAQTPEEVLAGISVVKRGHQAPQTRKLVQGFSWENMLKTHWQDYLQ